EMPLAHESSALARRIGSLRDTLQSDIAALTLTDTDADATAALNALVEANVRAQFSRLLDCDPVQTLLASGRPLSLHGCVYDLASGHLTTLVEHLSPQEHAP
ncbi:carbonic anhydrase, partial [Klebsiella aerogenes]